MIDRWILVEIWLALGLRMRFARKWGEQPPKQLAGENNNLWYAGHGEWVVLPGRQEVGGVLGEFRAPEMSTDDMRHELAHWLSATPAERETVNFGEGDPLEERAVAAEKVIDAIVGAAARVVVLGAQRMR